MQVARAQKITLLFIVVSFVLSRSIVLLQGMQYITEMTRDLPQFLDLDLLRHHLLRCLFHLHAQPPLFNALVGFALKIGGAHYGDILLTIQLALGLAAICSVYLALIRVKVNQTIAVAAAFLIAFNPMELFYEFDPLYTEIVFALNCLLSYALAIYFTTRSRSSLYCSLLLGLTLTLTRASFLWLWLFVVIALLRWRSPWPSNEVWKAGAAALAIALLWPAKNYVLFHHFAPSTWAPYGLSKHWDELDPHQPLSHSLAITALQDEFNKVDDARSQGQISVRLTGYPELDEPVKATGGNNWNSLETLRKMDRRGREVKFLLRRDFKDYLAGVHVAINCWFASASQYPVLPFQPESVRRQFQGRLRMTPFIDRICCYPFGTLSAAEVSPPRGHLLDHLRQFCLGALFLYALLAACLLSLLYRPLWFHCTARKSVVILLLSTVIYLFTVTNLAEIGENMRFRYEVQGPAFIVAAIFLQQLLDYRRRKPLPAARKARY